MDHQNTGVACNEPCLSLIVRRPYSLDEVLKDLHLAIAEVMSNLFDLERATINLQGEDKASDSKELRDALRKYWKRILEMLKAALFIGDDAITLRSYLIGENRVELPGLLGDLNRQIIEVQSLTSSLIESYQSPQTAYDGLWQRGVTHDYVKPGKHCLPPRH
jgi:hypothetical protein